MNSVSFSLSLDVCALFLCVFLLFSIRAVSGVLVAAADVPPNDTSNQSTCPRKTPPVITLLSLGAPPSSAKCFMITSVSENMCPVGIYLQRSEFEETWRWLISKPG